MRVWLIEPDSTAESALLPQLRRLADAPQRPLSLVGASASLAEFAERTAPSPIDAVVAVASVFLLDQPDAMLKLGGLPLLISAAPAELPHWVDVPVQSAVGLLPHHSGPEFLWAALQSLGAAQLRECRLREQIQLGQQRLNDRITIEKAKGVLQQKLGISEEQAYKQLRLQSRRQRRQIRDIAQSLLESHLLFETNGQAPRAGAARISPFNKKAESENLRADAIEQELNHQENLENLARIDRKMLDKSGQMP